MMQLDLAATALLYLGQRARLSEEEQASMLAGSAQCDADRLTGERWTLRDMATRYRDPHWRAGYQGRLDQHAARHVDPWSRAVPTLAQQAAYTAGR
jgi:hypothetical protein